MTSKVFPDGCTDIIFKIDKTQGTSLAALFGISTTFIEVDYPGSTQMFGIRFKPMGITAFTRIPVVELTDRSVELSLVDTLFDESFYEALPEKQSVAEMVAYTNTCLSNRISHLYHTDRQILRAVDLISHAKGQLVLADVASDVCLSQRHFERKFKSSIGVSPKMFAKIIRFKYVLHYMQKYPDKDLLTIAVDSGYYDRTHLIHDFKSLSGDTPNDFRENKSIFYAYGEDYSL
nr:helix-turn-helix domain-containing protein [Parabacteroides sp. PF5-9]